MWGRYVLRFLRRGIPSLFSDLSALCRASAAKAAALEKMFTQAAAGLKADGTLRFSTLAAGETEDPACLVWVLFFLAQFFDQAGYAPAVPVVHSSSRRQRELNHGGAHQRSRGQRTIRVLARGRQRGATELNKRQRQIPLTRRSTGPRATLV